MGVCALGGQVGARHLPALGKLWHGFGDEWSVCMGAPAQSRELVMGVERVSRPLSGSWQPESPNPATPAMGRKGRVPASSGMASPSCG